MKLSFPALAASIVTTFLMGNVFAQNFTPARPTAGNYYYVQDKNVQPPSPSDVKPPEAPPKPMDAPMVDKDEKEEDDAKEEEEEAPKPHRLIGDIGHGWSLTGWLEGGGMWNNHGAPFNGTLTFPDRPAFQANQMYAVLEKKLTEECCCDIGGRVDFLYGIDYLYTMAAGLELDDNAGSHWNRFGQNHGIALPQFYVEFGNTDLSVKVGHFYTSIGNEVVTAPDNFFYTHAYTMQYGEPFTHSGVMLMKKLSDTLTVHACGCNGWDKLDADTDRLSFLGGATKTWNDGKTSLAFSAIPGDEDGTNAAGIAGNRTMYSIVFKHNLCENLQYVAQHDHGVQENFNFAGQSAEWYGVNQYLFYTVNDCVKAGVRYEWFRDDDGFRVGALRAPNPVFGQTYVGHFHELSAGLNITPNNNVIIRPELRWDWFNGDAGVAGNGIPFGNRDENTQLTAGFDVIVLW